MSIGQVETSFVTDRLKRSDRVWLWRSYWVPRDFLVGRTAALSMATDGQMDAHAQIGFKCKQVVYAPPGYDLVINGVYDLTNSRNYIQSYTGRDIDVVVIAGIAPVACARQVAECAQFGPHPDMKIFLLYCDEQGSERIYTDTEIEGGGSIPRYFDPVERQGSAMLMRMVVR